MIVVGTVTAPAEITFCVTLPSQPVVASSDPAKCASESVMMIVQINVTAGDDCVVQCLRHDDLIITHAWWFEIEASI
jgi:hypothetical protein